MDPKSNNSNRLAQVSQEIAGTKAYRVADVSEIQLEWLQGVEKRSCYSRCFYSNANYERSYRFLRAI
ncbi:hypothetical protein ACT7DF_30205 [Bacillus cereus]